jgi:K+-transporting ATPase KdpF subunit
VIAFSVVGVLLGFGAIVYIVVALVRPEKF